jgi:hypothetical protein
MDPATFDFRLCAHGRLVECVRNDWTPILKENLDDEGGQGTYSMFLALIDGDWQIVR